VGLSYGARYHPVQTRTHRGQPKPQRTHERVKALPSKYFEALERSPDVMDGLTVFRGTRVPARAVFDYLVVNDTLATFLEDFPSVRREQVVAILELVRELLPA
jgi:uncharacterized protein (DUF433 family)